MGFLMNKILGVDSRRKDRTPICVLVEQPGFKQDYLDKTLDISESGMFIETDTPMELGEEVIFKFALPGRPPITVRGRVKRVNKRNGFLSPQKPEGMGIEFTTLDSLSTSILREFVSP